MLPIVCLLETWHWVCTLGILFFGELLLSMGKVSYTDSAVVELKSGWWSLIKSLVLAFRFHIKLCPRKDMRAFLYPRTDTGRGDPDWAFYFLPFSFTIQVHLHRIQAQEQAHWSLESCWSELFLRYFLFENENHILEHCSRWSIEWVALKTWIINALSALRIWVLD